MDQLLIDSAAHRLDEAERTWTQIRLLSLDLPNMGTAEVYAIQAAR